MRLAACLLTLALAVPAASQAAADLSPAELVRKSLENFQRDYKAAPQYTYTQRDEERNKNAVKVSVSNVFPVNGLPYERLISLDGKPLTAEENAREEEKLDKRRHERPSEQQKRLHDYQTSRAFLAEVPDAFNFKMVGEENINGRANYVIECTPKPGYRPTSNHGAMFSHIAGKLWIDKEDVQWTKAEAKVMDTISIGWILARIGPGASMRLEQTRINDQIWMTSVISVDGNARVMMVKDKPIRETITNSGFKPVAEAKPAAPVTHISKLQPAR